MRSFIAWLAKGFAFFIMILPQWAKNLIGDTLGVLWFDVFRIRRGVVLTNLEIAFPEMSPAERVKLGRWSLRNMGRDIVEYSYLPFYSRETTERLYEFENPEYLEEALKKGKGVCMLTLHMGNGDLATAALSSVGFPMTLISKEFKLKWLNDMWFDMRSKTGTKFIPPRNSSYAVLKGLKRKEVVVFVMDQFTGPPIGIRTTFMGKETGTGYGLAMMASRSKSPVIPAFDYRKKDGKHLIRFEPEIEFKEEDDADETIRAMTQKYNSFIEKVVKEHPDQWMWVHKRWKRFRDPKDKNPQEPSPYS